MIERTEQFFLETHAPETIISKFENEFCAEVRSKIEEYDWLSETYVSLSKTESEEEVSNHRSDFSEEISKMRALWKEVNEKTTDKIQKIQKLRRVSLRS